MKRAPSNAEWHQWGRDDPFYGVAAWAGRQRGGSNPWTAPEFYALGQSMWPDFRRRWVAYGVDLGRVVDIGCGAGRLTRAMAADFESVIGVDVSDGMLEVARANISESNVDLRLGDGINLPVETSTADAAFSAHVFQHLDSLALARANFSEIARILKPGATMMVHLPIVMPPTGIPGVLRLLAARNRLDNVRTRLKRWRRAPLMRLMQYPWPWLVRELPTLGLVDVELAVFLTPSSGIYHACILARRSAATTWPRSMLLA
jgi:SAM-dependent methyltransferase